MLTFSKNSLLPDWLLKPFTRGIRSADDFSSGVELEYLVIDSSTYEIVPYQGERGIEVILRSLMGKNGWSPVYEENALIGLSRNTSTISIEPGGAIEVATSPQRSLASLIGEMTQLSDEVAAAARDQSRALLCAGYHPFARKEDVSLVPKRRYHLMYPIMDQTGTLGQDMMKLTASVQVTLDFSSEKDALEKYALASRLVPVFISLSGNSQFRHGERQPYHSFRSHIWTDTDPRRSGLPSDIFDGPRTFADYASWALDAPVYFLKRDGNLIATSGETFRQLLTSAEPLTESDWELHLSTLFPWVRLRNYLELRAFDMVPPLLQHALVALVHGIFYHPAGLGAAQEVVGEFDATAVTALIGEAIRQNDNESRLLQSLCGDILTVATEGLPLNHRHLLEPLLDRLRDAQEVPRGVDEWVRGNIYYVVSA